jgi:hypothetical protein
VSLPYSTTTKRAEHPPSETEVEAFRSALESHLKPLFAYADVKLSVKARPPTGGSWGFLDVICDGYHTTDWDRGWLKELADDQGASSIFVLNPPHHIGIGILAQYRYWTVSRAHMCALTIIREYSNNLIAANAKAE